MSSQTVQTRPRVLIVDDSVPFRRYLRERLERALWDVVEWNGTADPAFSVTETECAGLSAAIADWDLGLRFPSGFDVLSTIKRFNGQVACLLYSVAASQNDPGWIRDRSESQQRGIAVLSPGFVEPALLHETLVAEAKRIDPGFQEPIQDWQALESYISPDSPSAELTGLIRRVGRRNIVLLIRALFAERREYNPVRYGFLVSGYSGAVVFMLGNPPNGNATCPRYILKLAQGSEGFIKLQREGVRFKTLILGREVSRSLLDGYVAEEIRLSGIEKNSPAGTDDGWFGIAYREVGNGMGTLMSFGQFYLEAGKRDRGGPVKKDLRSGLIRIREFLIRLYTDCWGRYHRRGDVATCRLWREEPGPGAYYSLGGEKRAMILEELEQLAPRARTLLEPRAGDQELAEQHVSRIISFMDKGRCGGRLTGATLFDQEFAVLRSGTHGDLHSKNILVRDALGRRDPFVIDFAEFQEAGHPFCDYVRLENDVRLRLMQYEDGSDTVDDSLKAWIRNERHLQMIYRMSDLEAEIPKASRSFAGKAYWTIKVIRALAYLNLAHAPGDPSRRISDESFGLQYRCALLHRTLASIASTDIVVEKKLLAMWLASWVIAEL